MIRSHPAHYPASGRRPRAAGFTLVELMIVLILIAIITAMVVPNLGGTTATVRLDASARTIAGLMDYCYRASVASGRVYGMVFDPRARRFDVFAEAPQVPAGLDYEDEETASAIPAEGESEAEDSEAAGEADGSEADWGAEEAGGARIVPVSLPGFVDRRLPEGIGLTGMATFQGAASEEEGAEDALGLPVGPAPEDEPAAMDEAGSEGDADDAGDAEPLKIFFFPDGTSEFARLELSTPEGQRRQVWLNGISGAVTIVDPATLDEEAAADWGIVNEDEEEQWDESESEEPEPTPTPNANEEPSGNDATQQTSGQTR